MCGISGYFSFKGAPENPEQVLALLGTSMQRRGPDASGQWLSQDARVGFSFRRLSILDLSEEGNQPMRHPQTGDVLVFNGEIYNFRELRRKLMQEGCSFRSQSDSEVVLMALASWGKQALNRFNGMFALAFFHAATQTVWLARDPFGIKPLHFQNNRNGICFASQLSSLLHSPFGTPNVWSAASVKLFINLAYLPAPYGFFEDTFQVRPGECIEIAQTALAGEIYRPWPEPFAERQPEWNETGELFDEVVKNQMVADVPLGVFLSGGMDSAILSSSAVVHDPSIEAFTVGVPDWRQDESEEAKITAQELSLKHHVGMFKQEQVLDLVGPVLKAQTEPFGDYSLLPTFLVCQMAREHVTVALSGDGSDELFFGYPRPFSLLKNAEDFSRALAWRKIRYKLGAWGLASPKSQAICHPSPGAYYHSVHGRLRGSILDTLFKGPVSFPGDFNLYQQEPASWQELFDFSRRVELAGQLQRCLKKVDMASMFHSLEVRVPFLDDRVVQFAFSLSRQILYGEGQRKSFLRRYMAKRHPRLQFSSEKKGFLIPLTKWLKGPLRELVEDTFQAMPNQFPFLEPKGLSNIWQQHLKGQHQTWALWSLLSLGNWAKRMDDASP